jgi:predicted RNase H-like HicB family nuclease
MKYHFEIREEDIGYSAFCIEIEGCRTQGDTIEELRYNMKEALDLCLAEPEDSTLLFPMPKKRLKLVPKKLEAVSVSPNVAFAMLLRTHRLNSGKTQHEYKDILGFKNVYQYQRLENPETNPGLKMIASLRDKLPGFDPSLIF